MPSFCKSDCLTPNSILAWYNFPANFNFSRCKSLAFIFAKVKINIQYSILEYLAIILTFVFVFIYHFIWHTKLSICSPALED